MADNANNLSIVFDKLGFPKDHVEFLLSKLFKYRDDPIIKIVCGIVNDNIFHIQNFYEVLDEAKGNGLNKFKSIEWSGTKPLMFNTPKDPTSLRIYPDILVSNGTKENLTNLDSSNCISVLKDFIEVYEAGTNAEYGKVKWEGDIVNKRLNQYIDMPTAKALTRYANLNIKDDQIRDLAIRIDEYRKPLELLWADSPEDYTRMYTGGQESCMTPDKYSNFKFMLEMGLCPASMYAFFPHCRGAYIQKNGKTVARAICYDDGKGKWSYGRIYPVTPEYKNKFVQCLREAGINAGESESHNPSVGTKFTFKAFLKKDTKTYFAPIAYADNMDRQNWSGTFNDETKEFTFEYGNKDPSRIPVSLESRNGHILASHYMTMECNNCGRIMRGEKFLTCKDTSDVFCTDDCALQAGYMKVWSGNSIAHYQKDPDNELIDIAGISSVKFSTLKAAEDNGMARFMEEPGILTEEGSIKVAMHDNAHQVILNDASGKAWVIETCAYDIVQNNVLAIPKVPFNVEKHKTVLYDTDANIVKRIAA